MSEPDDDSAPEKPSTASAARGRVLTAWRMFPHERSRADVTNLVNDELHREGETRMSRSLVGHWETGRRSISERHRRALFNVYDLSPVHRQAMRDMITAAGAVALPPVAVYRHNFPEAGEQVWVWIRRPDGPGGVDLHFWWGAALRGPFKQHVPAGGVFVQFPTSVVNPPLEVAVSSGHTWIAFGRGVVPGAVAAAVDAGIIDAMALVENGWAPEAFFDAAVTEENANLAATLPRLRRFADRFKVKWALVEANLGTMKSDRAPYPAAGVAAEVPVDGDPGTYDGFLTPRLMVSKETVSAWREARGMSRREVVEAVNSQNEGNAGGEFDNEPISTTDIETIEKHGRLPSRRLLLARLDTAYDADGVLGIDVVMDPATGPRTEFEIVFPSYWVGPVWVQARGPDPDRSGTLSLLWWPWKRSQEIRSGGVLTTRRADVDAAPLLVTVPPGWRLAAGMGVPPLALDINRGWWPANPAAASEIIMDTLNSVRDGLRRNRRRLPPGES